MGKNCFLYAITIMESCYMYVCSMPMGAWMGEIYVINNTNNKLNFYIVQFTCLAQNASHKREKELSAKHFKIKNVVHI